MRLVFDFSAKISRLEAKRSVQVISKQILNIRDLDMAMRKECGVSDKVLQWIVLRSMAH